MFSQMAVVASKLAVAKNFPQGDQAQDRTVRVWVSSRTALQCQRRLEGVCSQIRTVLSPLQEANTGGLLEVPVAGFQAKLQTLSECPARV